MMTLCDNIFASPVGCTVPWFKLNVLVYNCVIFKPEPFAVIITNCLLPTLLSRDFARSSVPVSSIEQHSYLLLPCKR